MNKQFTVYEHEKLYLGENGLTKKQLEQLQVFHERGGHPYFSLGHKYVKFCEQVGVLQLADFSIEILPKADKSVDQNHWRKMLIDILRAVDSLPIQTPSSSQLKLKPNAILSLYFDLYIKELQYLLHRGLIKRYKKVERNQTALKGKLIFAKQLQKNICQQQRFYLRHSQYNKEHLIHQILYKALILLSKVNREANLKSKIGSLLLDFPPMPDLFISEASFQKISFHRNNEHYRRALAIARLLLLHYHPDLQRGQQEVLALMFDMNALWERFIFKSLKKQLGPTDRIWAEPRKKFWQFSDQNSSVYMKPDIILQLNNKKYVLDCKWKRLDQFKPSPHDLRQLYVYLDYYEGQKAALIHPNGVSKAGFFQPQKNTDAKDCSVLGVSIPSDKNIGSWQQEIFRQVKNWAEE